MPLRKKNERLINDLESKKKSLRNNQTALKELKEQKDACDKDIMKSNEEIKFQQNEIKKSSAKVERCRNIYEGLAGERVRWSESVKKHEGSNNKIVGDCILGASFLTYQGFFDKKIRDWLSEEIKRILKSNALNYNDKAEDIITFLNSTEDRLFFKKCELPDDTLLIENATILKSFNRQPMIIDPNGQISK